MRLQDSTSRSSDYLPVLRLVLIGTFAALGVVILLLVAHAATGSEALLLPMQVLSAALGLLGASSLVLGIAYVWSAYPKHHKPVLFLILIALGTFSAHLYVLGSPPAGTSGSLTADVGVQLQDSQIQVKSTLHDQNLSVVVRSTGGNAIGDLQLSVTGASLLGGGFSPQPSFSSPLQSGSATSGTWQVSGNVSQVDVSYQYLTCYDAGSGHYGCVMDEAFYVPEAMGLLAGQPCSDGFADGYHCHMEHPFLAPALVAAGMAVFGEFTTSAWRVFPALLGTFSVVLVFGIAWKLSNDKKIAYLASLFVALDVMFFSQSSAALLDIPEIFFGLLAAFAYVWNLRFWRFDRYIITGALLGLAGLAKETAIFIALGLLTYILFFEEGSLRKKLLPFGKVVLVLGVVFIIGLQVYDSTLVAPNGLAAGIQNSCPGQTAYSATPNFVDHIRYMLCYGSSLKANTLLCQAAPTGASGYWCKYPTTAGNYEAILPTDWLVFYTPVAYYSTSVNVCTQSGTSNSCYTYVQLAYYGVTNLVVTWAAFLWVPLLAYALYRGRNRTEESLETFGFTSQAGAPAPPSESRFAGFVLAWFAWNYVPYLFLLLDGRVTYPFYAVPLIPALALGAAYFLTAKWIPKWLVAVFVLAAPLAAYGLLGGAVSYYGLVLPVILAATMAGVYLLKRNWLPRWLIALYILEVFVFFFIFFPSKAFLPDWLKVMIAH